jgi:hypothetical protein
MNKAYQNLHQKSTPDAHTCAGATIGYTHPGEPFLIGVVIPGGQIETRSIDAGRDTRLLITTLRCGCDFEIVTMEPINGEEKGGGNV